MSALLAAESPKCSRARSMRDQPELPTHKFACGALDCWSEDSTARRLASCPKSVTSESHRVESHPLRVWRSAP